MDSEFIADVMTTAIQRELSTYNKEHPINWAALAESHAFRMLDEIIKVLNERIPDSAKVEKILKIVAFCSVPPHTVD